MLNLDIRLNRGGFTLDARLELSEPVTGFFGPSGSGKSTLLGVIGGLIRPDSGRVVLQGTTLFDSRQGIHIPPHRRRIGLVFQDSRLFPHLSVRNNLLYGFRILPPGARLFTLAQVAELLEIGHLLERRPHYLSGGEKQRVALGRALLCSPRLLLLDEPLASLDERLKQQILPFLRRVKADLNIPMIYVSHAINEILHLTRQVAFIDSGRIIAHGPFAQTIRSEQALALAQSLGLENVLQVNVINNDADLACTLVRCHGKPLHLPASTLAPGATAYVSVRAGSVAIARAEVSDTTIQNQLPGTVMQMTRVADRILAEVDIGTPIIAEVTIKAVHDLNLKVGERVYCLIKAQGFSYLGENHRQGWRAPA